MEYGIFTDEGCLENGFHSIAEAQKAEADRYAEEDSYVAEVCPDHPEQPRESCEDCHGEEE